MNLFSSYVFSPTQFEEGAEIWLTWFAVGVFPQKYFLCDFSLQYKQQPCEIIYTSPQNPAPVPAYITLENVAVTCWPFQKWWKEKREKEEMIKAVHAHLHSARSCPHTHISETPCLPTSCLGALWLLLNLLYGGLPIMSTYLKAL